MEAAVLIPGKSSRVLVYQRSIYLSEFTNRYKTEECFDMREIEVVKEPVGDLLTLFGYLRRRQQSAPFQVDLAKLGFGHLLIPATLTLFPFRAAV